MLKDYLDNEINIGDEVIIIETKYNNLVSGTVKSMSTKMVTIDYIDNGTVKTTRRYTNCIINKTHIGSTILESFHKGQDSVISVVEILTGKIDSGSSAFFERLEHTQKMALAKIFNIRECINKLRDKNEKEF